jgi:hypothetical protein
MTKSDQKYRTLSIAELNDSPQGQPLKELVSGNLRNVIVDEHIETLCVFGVSDDDYDPVFSKPLKTNDDWQTWDDDKILQTFATDGENFMQNFSTSGERTYWPCSVHVPEDEYGDYYTIRMQSSPQVDDGSDKLPWEISNIPRFITGYPKESIRYFYRAYKSDMHLDGIFRRHIDIDDSIFPEVWKNRKSKTSVS